MRIAAFIITLFALLLQTRAQDIIYTKADSIFIEKILVEHPCIKFKYRGERAVAVAKEFIGRKYVSGTLDRAHSEPLFISTTELDCTTFIELVAAATMCNEKDNSFENVLQNIEKIRYRNGTRNGYDSRLHYISWWIDDNTEKGIIEEIYSAIHTTERQLNLNYMSRNKERYSQLKDNPELVKRIEEYEKAYQGKSIRYIPKELTIYEKANDVIKDGDIIAIVTDLEGLDVTHMGIACHINKELHIIHASSSKKMVICDTIPLHDYLARNRHNIGIRVLRIK